MRRTLALLLAALLLAALLVALFAEARSVGAQSAARWIFAGYSPDVRHTWWTRPGPDGELHVVVTGGGTGRALCQHGVCVLNVWGPWTRADVDGVTLWPAGTVYLPMVTR